MTDFAANLRVLCSEKHSVSSLCREIGINRQQFGRYLKGGAVPSAHNLRRICSYFGIDERDLFLAHDVFRMRYATGAGSQGNVVLQSLMRTFPGDRLAARRYIGLYHSHFLSPSWPNTVFRALVQIFEREGLIVSRSVERAIDPSRGVRQRTKYHGVVAMLADRLFVVEREVPVDDCIVETILFPARRQQLNYLRGMTLGMSWRPRRMPFSSKAIWKRLRDSVDVRTVLGECGAFPLDSREIDPVVRQFLGDESFPSNEEMRSGEFF